MWGVELTVMLAMIGITGVFAGYEIALAAVSRARLQVLVREKRRGADAALSMRGNMEASFAVVQLGMTLAGTIAAATGGAEARETLVPVLENRLGLSSGAADALALTVLVVPLTGVMLVFGELFPKVFGLRNKEWVCLKLSPIMHSFAWGIRPAVWLLENTVTIMRHWSESWWRPKLAGDADADVAELQELRATAMLARTSRLIGHREEGIILGATRLASRPVSAIALPADHISLLDANALPAQSLVAAHLDMHTRFPVTERAGDPQAIIGYVTFKDIVAHMRLAPSESTIRGVLRPLLSLPHDMPIADCLDRLLREHTHIALVRDAAGQVVGMITLQDILEEFVGDIQDEYDRLPPHVLRSGNAWIVGGGTTLGRLKEIASIDLTTNLPPSGAANVSEWLIGHLGREVQRGDVLARDGLRVVVRKVRRHKLQEAQISRLATTSAGSTSLSR
jgi:putative hemolysin